MCTECEAGLHGRADLLAENERLKAVILWADGQGDRFPPRPYNDDGTPKRGLYWWRKELMQRFAAALAPATAAGEGEEDWGRCECYRELDANCPVHGAPPVPVEAGEGE